MWLHIHFFCWIKAQRYTLNLIVQWKMWSNEKILPEGFSWKMLFFFLTDFYEISHTSFNSKNKVNILGLRGPIHLFKNLFHFELYIKQNFRIMVSDWSTPLNFWFILFWSIQLLRLLIQFLNFSLVSGLSGKNNHWTSRGYLLWSLTSNFI